jgi:hypothetical protein
MIISVSGLYSGVLSSEVHETIPRKVSPRGEYISHNLTSFHDDGQVHFNISLHDKEHLLILEPVRNFLAPALVIERRRRDTHVRSKPSDKSKNCHFQGIVHGQPNSRVAVSTCNGLVSLFELILTTFEKAQKIGQCRANRTHQMSIKRVKSHWRFGVRGPRTINFYADAYAGCCKNEKLTQPE